MRATLAGETEHDDVVTWRESQLLRSGFPPALASDVAYDGRYDLHRLIELVEHDCAPELAVRILAPLDVTVAA